MTVWKAGMLAVCVDDAPCRVCGAAVLKMRQIYQVVSVQAPGGTDIYGWYNGWPDGLALELLGDSHRCFPDEPAGYWGVERFRPAVQDDQSADEDFRIDLGNILKRSKPVDAPLLPVGRHHLFPVAPHPPAPTVGEAHVSHNCLPDVTRIGFEQFHGVALGAEGQQDHV